MSFLSRAGVSSHAGELPLSRDSFQTDDPEDEAAESEVDWDTTLGTVITPLQGPDDPTPHSEQMNMESILVSALKTSDSE